MGTSGYEKDSGKLVDSHNTLFAVLTSPECQGTKREAVESQIENFFGQGSQNSQLGSSLLATTGEEQI
jgi:hypothetical protein